MAMRKRVVRVTSGRSSLDYRNWLFYVTVTNNKPRTAQRQQKLLVAPESCTRGRQAADVCGGHAALALKVLKPADARVKTGTC
jgi:hypothetical protein